MDEVYVEFCDKNNKEQKCLSQPFYHKNGFIKAGTKVKIMFHEKDFFGVSTRELRIVDEEYVKKAKINSTYVILAIAVLFLSIATILLSIGIIK